MRKRIVNKLRSRTGASISFALLLFLVCAVLCSVILTAATTASGRMSNMAETDQRYYAVTSAAELMKDLINGQTVTIEKVTTGTRTEVYVDGVLALNTSYNADPEAVHIITSDPAGSSTIDDDHPTPTFTTLPADAAYKYYFKVDTSADLQVEVALGEGDSDALGVTISESVDRNGDITFTVGNANSYQVKLVFSASVNGPTVSETAGDSTTEVTPDPEDEYAYTITTPMTKTETTTLTWTLTGIETIS